MQNEQTTISQTYMLIVEDAAQFFKAHQMHLLWICKILQKHFITGLQCVPLLNQCVFSLHL